MTGAEIAIGYLFAWLVGKAKRVAGRADAEVDRALDEAMDQLHDLVGGRLGEDPALHRLTEEAESGRSEPADRTRQRVRLALEEAAEQDPGFGAALEAAVARVRDLTAGAAGTVAAGDGGQAVGGDVHIQADNHSAAAWTMGDVTTGNPRQPGTPQG